MTPILFWHRRDLRLTDNAGLARCLTNKHALYPVFIFDTCILSQLKSNDQRMIFIHREVQRLKKEYQSIGGDLHVFVGDPKELIPKIASKIKADKVVTNRDYEPYARERDQHIEKSLRSINVGFESVKDHVIFEIDDVLKKEGSPYTVYTPYSKKWKVAYLEHPPKNFSAPTALTTFLSEKNAIPSLENLGFSAQQTQEFPNQKVDIKTLKNYADTRDTPSIRGTSRISIHLRFGTISIRQLVQTAWETNEKYLNELIWRDFYQMILYHFPHSATGNFRSKYDVVQWRNNPEEFQRWCEGKTGYPLVDAGMRELNETGFMHNRVRMVVASFLCKHLLIDWRWGEGYFAQKLLDYDMASNVGGWQWAAGSGCDAAPYFRVFNPTRQQERFDPNGKYIRQWVKEFDTLDYPAPMVEHAFARNRALETYQKGLN